MTAPPGGPRKLFVDDDFVLLQETRPFEKLSDDVVVVVLSWLGPRDLARMAQVSKYFNNILKDKSFREFHRLKVRSVESRMATFKEELATSTKVPKVFSTGGEVVGTIASAVVVGTYIGHQPAATAGGYAGRKAGEGLGRLWVDSFYTRWIEKKKHPLFREDDSAPNCRRCSVAFGMTVWRQHCRACGSAVCSKCLMHEQRIPEIGYEEVMARVCDPCHTELEQPNRRVVLVGPEVRGLVMSGSCTVLAAEEAIFQHMYKCLRCDVLVCVTCIERCHALHPHEETSEFVSGICACSMMGQCKTVSDATTEEARIEEHKAEEAKQEEERFARLGCPPLTREEIAQMSEAEAVALFTALDMNGDGRLSAADWRAWKQHNLPAVLLAEPLLARDDRLFSSVAPNGVVLANFREFLELLTALLEQRP